MSAEASVLLRASGIERSYGHVRALAGADLELRPREIHALLGDNGAGKSTLVKTLSGVVRPDAGTIELEGRELRFSSPAEAHEAGIETVYQDLALAPTLDAGENVFLGRELYNRGPLRRLRFVDRAEMRRRTTDELEQLGIRLPSATAKVGSLSGGQRQAVAIARSVIWGRKVLIMDEPTAALGPRQTQIVLDVMRKVRAERDLTILWISHNLPEVFEVADRVTVLRLGRRVLTSRVEDTTTEALLRAMTGLDEESAA
jgi:ABC-type sugar transport system ATPase subunit